MPYRVPALRRLSARLALAAALVLPLAACDGEPVDYSDTDRYEISWLWANGSALYGEPGVYGSLGVAAPTNRPGAREGAVSWVDADGGFWLFGGLGYDANGDLGRLNDLWRLEAGGWAWVSGSSLQGAAANHGSEDVPDPANQPGARSQAIGWADEDGNLWLFGGNGYDGAASPALGRLGDLWKYGHDAGLNAKVWTWVGGSKFANQPGIYGERGTADPANVPGGRHGAAGWVDEAGRFWLFGGSGYDQAGTLGWLNDLWRFDGTGWTWMRGSKLANAPSVLAARDAIVDNPATPDVDETAPAITADQVTPGGRQGAAAWYLPDPDPAKVEITETGWLFGGAGNDASGNRIVFAETWRFDGSNWFFAHGLPGTQTAGNYGGRGMFSLTTLPPSRSRAVAWAADGTLWLFGGAVEPGGGRLVYPNDLWRFDAVGWTWVGGSDDLSAHNRGEYPPATGGRGLPAGREGGSGWVDATGGLWLFGGAAGSGNAHNDFWFYSP